MSLREQENPTEAELNHLVLSDRSFEARTRARRIGQHIGRIIAVAKTQRDLEWSPGNKNEQIMNTTEAKVGKSYGAWLSFVVDTTPDKVTTTPEWADRITQVELTLNQYDSPFDVAAPPIQDPSNAAVVQFTPSPEPNKADDIPFKPYDAAYDHGSYLQAYETDITIGVLSMMADQFEADQKSASAK